MVYKGIRVPANVFIENIAAKTEQDLGFILPEDVYLADDFYTGYSVAGF